MKYRIELLDAEHSGSLGAGELVFSELPLLPSVGDYLPINGSPYKVARRDFFFGNQECVGCLQLRLENRGKPK